MENKGKKASNRKLIEKNYSLKLPALLVGNPL